MSDKKCPVPFCEELALRVLRTKGAGHLFFACSLLGKVRESRAWSPRLDQPRLVSTVREPILFICSPRFALDPC